MIRACANCQWWAGRGGNAPAPCRGAPPSVVVDIGGVDETRWPVTAPDDWCGSFRLAEPEMTDAEFGKAHGAMAGRLAGRGRNLGGEH